MSAKGSCLCCTVLEGARCRRNVASPTAVRPTAGARDDQARQHGSQSVMRRRGHRRDGDGVSTLLVHMLRTHVAHQMTG